MDVETALRGLRTADRILPRSEMRWLLSNWEIAAPRLLEMLTHFAEDSGRDEQTANALFFVVHLLGEKHETRAFAPLCRLLLRGELSESVLGDAITENLRGILIGTYDGDPSPLKQVIEATSADEYARAAALDAMAYLTRTGAFTDEEMHKYLVRLRSEMLPQSECYVWAGWIDAVANLGYEDLREIGIDLISKELVPYRVTDIAYFCEHLASTCADPERMAGFIHDRIAPFSDAIEVLSSWFAFSEKNWRARAEQPDEDVEEEYGFPGHDETYVNPLRDVGRNDPCPCGSGRKFKKCCLGKDGSAAVPTAILR